MGRTTAIATIIGANEAREYEFLVDTGSVHIGLSQEDIDELELSPVPNGVLQVPTATGIVERQSYWAIGEIDGRGFGTMITEVPIPLIGYHLLESLRYRVNPDTHTLERIPADEPSPPYMLIRRSENEGEPEW